MSQTSIKGFGLSSKMEWVVIVILIALAFMLVRAGGTFNNIIDSIKGGVGSITDSINLTDTEAEREKIERLEKQLAAINQQSVSVNAWSPFYWKELSKQGVSVKSISETTARQLSAQIWDAIGTIYDSPEQIEGAIKKLQYKSQVSVLADWFNKIHSRDLLGWLTYKLDTTAQKIILQRCIDYVNTLPNGLNK